MVRGSSSAWSSGLAEDRDTIVARATAAGRGALAVVRLTGARVRSVSARVVPELDLERTWRAQLVTVRDREGAELERAVVIPYLAPRSFTGEDMVELIVHGSSALVGEVLAACVAAGARPARPGEFTRRAVANGKLDLIQAEALGDLVAAETRVALANARRQLGGRLSGRVGALRADLTQLAAELEASVDLAAQGVDPGGGRLEGLRRRALKRLEELLSTAGVGGRIREGVRLVVAGPTNAGKSTLFNRLVGQARAIVSPHPGTTRDLVEAEVELGGVRVVVVDTAGEGGGTDAVELEGVARAREAAADAQAVVWMWPADGEGVPPAEGPEGPHVRVWSKADLDVGRGTPEGWLRVSCVTGEGLEELAVRLRGLVAEGVEELGDGVAVNERHRWGLAAAARELEGCRVEEPELAAEAVRTAAGHLAEVCGEVQTEEVLDRVFATFCVGK